MFSWYSPYFIDILTIIEKNVDFNKAEGNVVVRRTENDIVLKLIPYDFWATVKLLSRRDQDLWDIARLDELPNLKNNL